MCVVGGGGGFPQLVHSKAPQTNGDQLLCAENGREIAEDTED